MALSFSFFDLSRCAGGVGCVAVLGLVFLSGPAATTGFAVRSESTVHETFDDFHAGEFDGISLSREGTLRLAPRAELATELPEPIVWSAVAGANGELFVATGKQGRVYRVTGGGEEPEVVFEADEVLVRAMVLGPDGALYLGTSPDGRVYRLAPDEEIEDEEEEERARIFFDPDSAYIWDLLFGPDGYLLVATGDEGRIFRVPPGGEAEGEAEVYFESGESHVSVMAWDGDGKLLAGTSPQGYLYRIDGTDRAFVLFNSPDEEIRRIEVAADGILYVATFSGTGGGSGGQASAFISHAMSAIESAGNAGGDEEEGSNGNRPAQSARPVPRQGNAQAARISSIYRVEPDGFWETYWAMPRVAIHSLLLEEDGTLLAGSATEGGIFAIEGLRDWQLRQRLEPGSEVSEMLADGSTVWALTSNPARVFRLERERAKDGKFDSAVFDAEQVARWGRIYVEGQSRGSGALSVTTRSGNTEDPDDFWNDWAPVRQDASIASPPARYLQYRIEFAGDDAAGPQVDRVRFFHQRRNAAPAVTDIRVVTASIGLERYEMPPQAPMVDLEQLFRANRSRSQPAGGEPRSQVRASERPGAVTIVWRARDPNDDDLEYRVKARRAGDPEWIVLADEVRDTFHSFQSSGFPDGLYQAKVIASDYRSNPPGSALTGQRVSELFLIDNSPPKLTLVESRNERGSAVIRFRAEDEVSLISTASYSVNGHDLVGLFPSDGIFDAREETFEFSIEGLRPGSHHVLIRVTDEAGNASVLNVPVTVE